MDAATLDPTSASTQQEQPIGPAGPPMLIPSAKTPQAFYEEITERPDVRAILEELGRG